MTTLRTPNEVLEWAKDTMLKGRDPSSHRDWQLIVNCWAVNVAPEAIPLLCIIFDVPLAPYEVEAIIRFQKTGIKTPGGVVEKTS